MLYEHTCCVKTANEIREVRHVWIKRNSTCIPYPRTFASFGRLCGDGTNQPVFRPLTYCFCLLNECSLSYHLYAPNRYWLGQELAPFPSIMDGCQWVIEPVSRHFFINQDLLKRN